MSTLAELVSERRDLEDEVADAFGVLEDELEAEWLANEQAIEDKIEAWGHFLREGAAELATISAEIERLTNRKQARENYLACRRAFLQSQMEAVGLTKVDRPLLTVSLRATPPAVVCQVSPEHLPPEFRRVVPERAEADKRALLAAHKLGLPLPDGVYVETRRTLRIK